MAWDYKLLSMNHDLLYGIVANCFGLLGFPGMLSLESHRLWPRLLS